MFIYLFFFFNPLLDPPFRFRVTDLFGLFVVALANIELNYGWRICDLRLFNFPFVSSFLLYLSRLFLILFTFFSLFVCSIFLFCLVSFQQPTGAAKTGWAEGVKASAASAGTSGGPGGNLLGGTLTPADRHGSVQVVSSTNGDLGGDDPAGHSHTPITAQPEIEMAEETKYELTQTELIFNFLFFL